MIGDLLAVVTYIFALSITLALFVYAMIRLDETITNFLRKRQEKK